MKTKYSKSVLVEFKNSTPYVEVFTSNKPITIERVAKFYEETEGFNEERDSLTFLTPGEGALNLDEFERVSEIMKD